MPSNRNESGTGFAGEHDAVAHGSRIAVSLQVAPVIPGAFKERRWWRYGAAPNESADAGVPYRDGLVGVRRRTLALPPEVAVSAVPVKSPPAARRLSPSRSSRRSAVAVALAAAEVADVAEASEVWGRGQQLRRWSGPSSVMPSFEQARSEKAVPEGDGHR